MADHPSGLLLWLRANVIATITLIGTLAYTSSWALVTASRWIATNEAQINSNAADIVHAQQAIDTLKHDVVDVDRRLNEAHAREVELKGRLDVIDALSKATADRTFPRTPGR